MNRRHFFKLAAALPVVGPAAIKAAAVDPRCALMDRMMSLISVNRPGPTVYYMNHTVYQEFLRAKICRQAYLDQFKILGISPPADS